ncbi:MAG: D-alanine--D-alanine ligase [Actinobacteria bacterium]|nr:MAG: D-alanine--D-alanine ligase [Actinomycetota bacterium]
MNERIRLVVLFGGRSAEHEVSCVTAVHVLEALDPDRYDVLPVGITHEGRWVLAEEAQKLLAGGRPLSLPAALEAAGPEVDPLPALAGGASDLTTVVFPLLHGPFGEDGTVQGMLELAGVPYVGSGVLASALAMDKAKAKEVLAHHGLPQGRWLAVRESAVPRSFDLGWPVFVKPANLGSSVGVSKVAGPEELAAALGLAFSYDEWALVEEAIDGRELECGVLGNREPEASVVGEVVRGREFYGYEDKPVPDEVAAEVRRLALEAFAALRCEGMARVDFFYEETGRGLLLNEVNTIPGFTPISMYPKLWEASGVSYSELVDRLVRLALERRARRAGKIGRPRG